MSAIFASLDNRFSVASLRRPSKGLYASTIAPEQVAPSQLARMAALSVTLVGQVFWCGVVVVRG